MHTYLRIMEMILKLFNLSELFIEWTSFLLGVFSVCVYTSE